MNIRPMPQTQNISDYLKGFINGAHGAGLAKQRREAFALQRRFESVPFSYGAFEQALSENEPLPFSMDSKKLTLNPDTEPAALLDQIVSLLRRYLELCEPAGTQVFGDMLTTEEAAAYLGVSINTIKTHVHRVGDLVGEMKGHSLLFSREELDTLQPKIQPRRKQN